MLERRLTGAHAGRGAGQAALHAGMDALSQAEVGSALQVYFNLHELPQARLRACPPRRPFAPARAGAWAGRQRTYIGTICLLSPSMFQTHMLAAGHRGAHSHARGRCHESLGRPVPQL
jgi:hypothetical protein